MSFDSLLRAKLRDPGVMAGYLVSKSRRRRAAVESATVARLWHLGLAEDAERRGDSWHALADQARGREGQHAEDVADYFETLAADHRQAAER